jgi:hypothetical protein
MRKNVDFRTFENQTGESAMLLTQFPTPVTITRLAYTSVLSDIVA